jgi:hypothetical protein
VVLNLSLDLLSMLLVVLLALFTARVSFVFAQNDAGIKIVPGTLRIYGNDSYPVVYRRAQPIDSPRARYPGFKPGMTLLKAGTVRREGAKVLPCDILFERDVAVKVNISGDGPSQCYFWLPLS